MGRIERINLGGRRILVDSCPETTLSLADQGASGDSDLVADIIRIRDDLSDAQWEETLLHELMHFVWHLTPLPHLLEEHEETVVRALSPWLASVVRIRRTPAVPDHPGL